MPVASAIAMASGFSVLLFAIGLFLVRQPNRVRERLSQYQMRTEASVAIEIEAPFGERILRPVFRSLVQALIGLLPHSYVERTRRNLVLAGSPRGWDVRDFLAFQALATVGCAVLGWMVGRGAEGLQGLLFVVVLGGMGFVLPNFWLGGQIRARQDEIRRTLPDALDLLTICVEAGLGFDGALSRVAEKWDNALSQEFSRVLSEIRMGKSRRDALRDVVPRTDVPDLATFIAAVVQADQLGASIGNVLAVQAEQMRMKRRQRAEELAHKAPVKMIFPMVLLIFPAIYVVTLGPAIPSIIDGLS